MPRPGRARWRVRTEVAAEGTGPQRARRDRNRKWQQAVQGSRRPPRGLGSASEEVEQGRFVLMGRGRGLREKPMEG